MKRYKKFLDKFSIILLLIFYLLITKFTCLIKLITGFPCPSCGITRSYKALFHFNFSEAWNYNPLYWFIPPVILFILLSDKPLFNNANIQLLFFIFVFTIIISVYIYRMIILFPDTIPMDYNKNSLLYILYEKIRILFQNL